MPVDFVMGVTFVEREHDSIKVGPKILLPLPRHMRGDFYPGCDPNCKLVGWQEVVPQIFKLCREQTFTYEPPEIFTCAYRPHVRIPCLSLLVCRSATRAAKISTEVSRSLPVGQKVDEGSERKEAIFVYTIGTKKCLSHKVGT